MSNIFDAIGFFVLAYPLGMALIWLIGTIWHYFVKERHFSYSMKEQPYVSILIPAYNEMETIHNAVENLHHANYKNYEIIVINDGSTDRTADIVRSLLPKYPRLRFIDSKTNQGKAKALKLGTLAAKGEFLVCVDADAYLDEDAIIHLIAPMLLENQGRSIAAVTGNPRVRNRTNTLAKIQTAEYSSVVGMIKRTQQMLDTCNTVSGVYVAFRKQAIFDVGFWDEDMVTEDIAITWKLHAASWQIVYAPRAICWMLVPETFSGLQKQRLRWTTGGLEVLHRHFWSTIKRGDYRCITLLVEQIIGIVWAFAYVSMIPFIIQQVIQGNYIFVFLQVKILTIVCLINYLIAFTIDRKYDPTIFKTYFWVIWYPIAYWIFNVYIMILAVIKKVFHWPNNNKQKQATWESPDRGDLNDLGIFETDILFSTASIRASLIGAPITVILWIWILFYIFKRINEMINEVIVYNNTIVETAINSDNLFYVMFIIITIMFGVAILYFMQIISSFPKKQHSMITKKISDFENEELGSTLVNHYKIIDEIVVEENDVLNNI